MKVYTVVLLLAAVIFVECGHTFMGSNVMRDLVYHKETRSSPRTSPNRAEYVNFTLPAAPGCMRSIQGILAYDLMHSDASVNVTNGGIGYSFVTLRFKGNRSKPLHYEVYIYV